jgi:uncharacterized Fe-S cluster-containing protein
LPQRRFPGEPSCREDLHPFNPEAHLKEGDIFRRRPLGCPITHFAKVLKYDRAMPHRSHFVPYL